MENQRIIFTPDNEPYLGLESVFHFDQTILSCLDLNRNVVHLSNIGPLTEAQTMAVQLIPQSINLALSIRELIRQGYLFGAYALLRVLMERAIILLYLYYFPDKIEIWTSGWHKKAPGLSEMIDAISKKHNTSDKFKGKDVTATLNGLIHGKPESTCYSIEYLQDGTGGHSVSKIINRPDLCNEICTTSTMWLIVIEGMMAAYFPKNENNPK